MRPGAGAENLAAIGAGSENLTVRHTTTGYWYNDKSLAKHSIGTVSQQSYYLGTYYVLKYTVDEKTGVRTYADPSKIESFTRYVISNENPESPKTFPKGAARDDCAASYCTYDEEIKNFANWFVYYRSRYLLARGATGAALAAQADNSVRIGYADVVPPWNDSGKRNIDGVVTPYIKAGIRSFSGSDRVDFFDRLYNAKTEDNITATQTRESLDYIGKYFERTGAGSPWTNNPAGADQDSVKTLSCRRSYSLIVSDGMWNRAGAVGDATGNIDGTDGPSIKRESDGKVRQYIAAKPYADSYSGTLSDIAMYYWNRDLQPDIANNVQDSSDNIAFWQHLSNYVVGLGVDGYLNPSSDLPYIYSGDKVWASPYLSAENQNTEPSLDPAAVIDDMWHAAVNSRGKYFSAKNYTDLSKSLTQALSEISISAGTTGGSMTESAIYTNDSGVMYSSYAPTNWAGDLRYSTAQDGKESVYWVASKRVPIPKSRSIFTKDANGSTVAFLWDDLSDSQQSALGGDKGIVDYLRGDTTWEVRNRPATLAVSDSKYAQYRFRTRETKVDDETKVTYDNVLGDILGSNAVLIGPSDDYAYDALPDTIDGHSSYLEARAGFKKRTPVVFVGANDGMLHAFNSLASKEGGAEVFAYIPRSVLGGLKSYASPNYVHRMFVDGPLEPSDAYLTVGDKAEWRTVLLGSTGAGGRAIFALDVTKPSAMTKNSVLWEHDSSETDFKELGYTLSAPRIGVVQTSSGGQWVAVVPNGYESASHTAQLFILDLQDGHVLKRIDTGVGSENSPNGLGSVEVRVDEQRRIVAAYAGDKLGNLWKFDLSDVDMSKWSVSGGSQPLFKAKVGSGGSAIAQPITARPSLWRLDSGQVMVVFGTGKFFETDDDSTSLPVSQTIYAVAEPATERGLLRSDLQALTSSKVYDSSGITSSEHLTGVQITGSKVDLTVKKGWYLDIANLAGERVLAQANVIGGIVYLTSFAPSSGYCEFGGSSILYALNLADGSQTAIPQFDNSSIDASSAADCENGKCLSGLKIEGTTSALNYLLRATVGNTIGVTALGRSISQNLINKSLGGSVRYWRGNWREITQ